jgi:hypothetical protein
MVVKSRLLWIRRVALMEETRQTYKILKVNSLEKQPFGRPRRRWENNIKMDFRETGCEVDGIVSGLYAVAGLDIKYAEPSEFEIAMLFSS